MPNTGLPPTTPTACTFPSVISNQRRFPVATS
jgi:hypothetical protein